MGDKGLTAREEANRYYLSGRLPGWKPEPPDPDAPLKEIVADLENVLDKYKKILAEKEERKLMHGHGVEGVY